MKIDIYTDGSCRGNPGPSGWAYLIEVNNTEWKRASEGEPDSTNNRMEMTAVWQALEAIKELEGSQNVTIFSDSKLVLNTITKGWKRKANTDIWNQIDNAIEALTQSGWQLNWQWVKGHAGHKQNELVDDLAQAAAAKYSGKSKTLNTQPMQVGLGLETEDDSDLRNQLAENKFSCGRCNIEVAGVLSQKSSSSPIRVDCDKCGKYIKFAKQAKE